MANGYSTKLIVSEKRRLTPEVAGKKTHGCCRAVTHFAPTRVKPRFLMTDQVVVRASQDSSRTLESYG